MIRLRDTAPDDLPSLAGLFEDRFGHPITPEEWHWKYARLPGEARSRVAVDATGRIVAHAGALGLAASLDPAGGPDRTIWQLTDWAGSAAAGGLRPPLVELGQDLLADLPRAGDAPWIFGFPSERHFRLGRHVFGYRPLPAIMPLGGRLSDAVGPAAAALAGAVEASDHAGAWSERAWAACGIPSVRRSAAFLNWRYHARPGRYYRVYRIRPAGPPGGIDGLAVFAFVAALARGAELWLPVVPGGGNDGAEARQRWRAGLMAVARDLAAAGLERWELWPPPGADLGPLLEELGLAGTGEAVFMGCRGRRGSEGGPSPADPRFHYSMGDYDLA